MPPRPSCGPFRVDGGAEYTSERSNNGAPTTELTKITWINDGGTFGAGFIKVQGVDWTASYDWDMGDLGAWNTGITGTYYLHRYSVPVNRALFPMRSTRTSPRPAASRTERRGNSAANALPGASGLEQRRVERHGLHGLPIALLSYPIGAAEREPPMRRGGRYASGGTFPCLINNYSNIQPSQYLFDLSFGYDTGDTPANTYLKNVGVQFIVQNLMGIHPAFQYGPSNAGRGLAAYDILKPDTGRVFNVSENSDQDLVAACAEFERRIHKSVWKRGLFRLI